MIPRAASYLMQGYVARGSWPRFWARASLRVSCVFSLYKYHALLLYFAISTSKIFQERNRHSYKRFIPSTFTNTVILQVVSLIQDSFHL